MNWAVLGFGLVASGVLGGIIGTERKVGPRLGFLLGVCLGPIGILIIIFVGRSVAQRTPDTDEAQVDGVPGWHADPVGRFDRRFYDGTRWTDQVRTTEADGTTTLGRDPV